MIPNQPVGQPVEHPHANVVLLLGGLSLLFCGLTGPVAWVFGKRALDQIESSGGGYGGRIQVLLGYILGVVGTVMMVCVAILFFLVLLTS